MKSMVIAAVIAASLAAASGASANIMTFDITWSGAPFGNQASATGTITVDASALPNVGYPVYPNLPDPAVKSITMNVTDPNGGGGSFSTSDFYEYAFSTPMALDLNKQLIGQDVGGGCSFGATTGLCGNGLSGDFNFFSVDGAPTGVLYFDIETSSGDQMLVTSITPVPEPATWAMLILGVAMIGFAARRWRATAAVAA